MPALAMTWPRVPPPLAVIAASAVLQLRTSLRVQMCVRVALARYSFCPSVQYFDSEDRGGDYGRDEHERVSLPGNFAAPSSAVRGARGEERRPPTGPDFDRI